MDKIVVTPTQLQTMYDQANDLAILPFIERIGFRGEGENVYAEVFCKTPRQRKHKWWLYSFAQEAFYEPLPPRRKKVTATV